MHIITYDDLPQGGFAGLRERQFVTDERVFKKISHPNKQNGIGNFVYLADANFLPKGETGMHSHQEIDVISVMVSGHIAHKGSLEHGQDLEADMVQVQRAGGEGFSHNEINPDSEENHMIQLWVLPETAGEPAGYRVYSPKLGERLRVYGGNSDECFKSQTVIDVMNLTAGQTLKQAGDSMAFLSKGSGIANSQTIEARSLIRCDDLSFKATEESQLIVIYLI